MNLGSANFLISLAVHPGATTLSTNPLLVSDINNRQISNHHVNALGSHASPFAVGVIPACNGPKCLMSNMLPSPFSLNTA